MEIGDHNSSANGMIDLSGRNPATGTIGKSLLRIVVPASLGTNIFSNRAKMTTGLGPIMVATVANQLTGWEVEVIDENNFSGPRGDDGLPDHQFLARTRPAAVVGFSCGLTSTMRRVWQLAEFYHGQGTPTVAGGWHVHYCPQEALAHKIDVVVHGDGEPVIKSILQSLGEGGSLRNIPGISFKEHGRLKANDPPMLEADLSELPFPDFRLLKYATMVHFPIGRIRGCGMNCEFCSVKGRPRSASPEHLFQTVNWLVETMGARTFFIVDDRIEEDPVGTAEFFTMIAKKHGNRLKFGIQMRLETARNTELLRTMKRAGVVSVFVGYESPIDEELRAMNKGMLSANMIEWTKILRRDFWVHANFIWGYPLKKVTAPISISQRLERFEEFMKRARPHACQVWHVMPLVGTSLRERLEADGDLLPVSWSEYDGCYVCYRPKGANLREFQAAPMKIYRAFYGLRRKIWEIVAHPADSLGGWGRARRTAYQLFLAVFRSNLLRQMEREQARRFEVLEQLFDHRLTAVPQGGEVDHTHSA